jgi:putative transposase
MRFAEGEFYHIYNRGVEKRAIFMDRTDYERLSRGLSLFNSNQPFEFASLLKGKEKKEIVSPAGRPLVSIVSYVLMKNHVHLLALCRNAKDFSDFLRKVFIGYSMYFNAKYNRSGVLFQGRTKSKHIDKDSYLTHLVDYIHLNPLDYILPDWRTQEIEDTQKAKEYISNYEWSSFAEIIGKKFDPALDYNLVTELFPDKKELENSAIEWATSTYTGNSDLFFE